MKNHRTIFREIYKNQKEIPPEEINSEIDFVIEILTGLKSCDFLMGKTLTEEQTEAVNKILQTRVQTGRPLQHLTGLAFFCGRKYLVNEKTLIPRPETELLIEECKKRLKKNNPKILDIGTGSGCIAIELALIFPQSEITATDIMQETLDIAKQNAVRHKISDRITFLKSDLFENITESYDVIVSNPPYIDLQDLDEVQKDVYEFEPHIALFAANNGLYFYRKITEESTKYLNKNGILAFETGWKQAQKVSKIMAENNFVNILLTKDLDENERIVSGLLTN